MAERRKRLPYKRWLKDFDVEIPRTTTNSRNKRIHLVENEIAEGGRNDNPCDITIIYESELNVVVPENQDQVPIEREGRDDPPSSFQLTSDVEIPSPDITLECADSDNEAVNDHNCTDSNYNQMFAEGSSITLIVAELLIISFAIRHKLTDTAIQDLLELINILIPHSALSRSRHLFLKKFDSKENVKMMKKFYCSVCNTSIPADSKICGECNHNCSSDFFYYFPIEDALTEFVNSPDYLIMVNRRKYSDVNDSSYVKNNKNIATTDITIQFNTDGVSPHHQSSASQSLWPLQVMINNLPLALKRKYLLLCGLWFSATKPPMNLYLKYFVEEMCKLHKDGILRKNDGIMVRVHVVVCVCDSVARPTLQNISQFNGKFGCTYCLQEGTIVENTRIYPKMCIEPLRNLQQHMRDAQKAIEAEKPVNGVKGPSVLLLLPNFDVTQCCSPDYMHSMLLGVVKLFVEEWFESSNHTEAWYLGGKKTNFDEKLMAIRPPCEISRPPRSVVHRKKWKASELRNFVLYYSYYCLDGLWPNSYLRHWSALICSLSIFLSPTISEHDWIKGAEALVFFVEQIGKLYNDSFYKFNVHLMLHIPNWVQQFGALWSSSCFPYEHYNGVLNKLFVNGTGVQQQICKRYFRYQKVMKTADEIFLDEHLINTPLYCKQFITHLLHDDDDEKFNYEDEVSDFLKFSSRTMDQHLDVLTKRKIKAVINSPFEVADSAIVYQFFKVKGMLVHSYDYCDLKKRNNSVVKLEDGSMVIVCKIFKVKLHDDNGVEVDAKVVIEVLPLNPQPVHSQDRPRLNKFIRPVIKRLKNNPSSQRRILLPKMLEKKCVYITNDDQVSCYVLPLINYLENGW
ncbi:uncharacterized protein LOC135839119 [Planococcus citri]|uniref:uncharacterized protein LOC135839119 n=1 Tax=Planococcus citri TaxID=170843 RepID=UPI0031F9A879